MSDEKLDNNESDFSFIDGKDLENPGDNLNVFENVNIENELQIEENNQQENNNRVDMIEIVIDNANNLNNETDDQIDFEDAAILIAHGAVDVGIREKDTNRCVVSGHLVRPIERKFSIESQNNDKLIVLDIKKCQYDFSAKIATRIKHGPGFFSFYKGAIEEEGGYKVASFLYGTFPFWGLWRKTAYFKPKVTDTNLLKELTEKAIDEVIEKKFK